MPEFLHAKSPLEMHSTFQVVIFNLSFSLNSLTYERLTGTFEPLVKITCNVLLNHG